MTKRERLFAYIEEARTSHCVPDYISYAAEEALRKIESDFPLIATPDCSWGISDTILLSWDSEEYHLECQVEDSDKLYFFYRNRLTKQIAEYPFKGETSELKLPEEWVEYLTYF